MKIEILYITVGLLTGVIITFLLLDNFYQKELNRINIEYKKNMEEMKIIPEIVFIENKTCPEIKYPVVICEVCHDVPSFMSIAENIANDNEYVLDVYDCTEFSRDLEYKLRRSGYKARIVHGYYYSNGESCDVEVNCKHDWICLGGRNDYGICIEATEGNLIPHEFYGRYYVFVGEGKW